MVLQQKTKQLNNLCKENDKINVNRLLQKMTEVAIRSLHCIYKQQNKPWSSPEISKFY